MIKAWYEKEGEEKRLVDIISVQYPEKGLLEIMNKLGEVGILVMFVDVDRIIHADIARYFTVLTDDENKCLEFAKGMRALSEEDKKG